MSLLKRVLPFVIGAVAGAMLVGLSGLFLRAVTPPAKVSPLSEKHLPFNSSDCTEDLSSGEGRLLFKTMIGGLGSRNNRVIDIMIARSPIDVEIQEGARIYYQQHTTKDVRILSAPQPSYWKEKRLEDDKDNEYAMLRMTLSASGEVTNIIPLHPLNFSKERLESVIAAAKQIHFVPATEDGQAVSQNATVLYKRGVL